MVKKDTDAGITVKKSDDFSEWYTQLVQKAELADIRYNIKGFTVFREWSVLTMKKMYNKMETVLERKGHLPLVMPTLIPEQNFQIEAEHIKGFTPEVFWVTEHGEGKKFDERMALRPTSETAFYQMYSLWIRSYNDLPYKRYQSVSVFRCEGKATRPFFRGREFLWIETHNAFANHEDAYKQVLEDMETTDEVLLNEFGLPFIFFERPQWDKFPGAQKTFASDALMPSGKVIQLPSTHLLGQGFAKSFNIEFTDEKGKTKTPHLTCYGPAISRIYGAMIALHGDDKGLVLPFDLAPIQIVIVPILFEKTKEKVLKKCNELKKKLSNYIVEIDERDQSPGWKFNQWEMKGVPIRIEVGPKDLENKSVMLARRDKSNKDKISEKELVKTVDNIAKTFTKDLVKKAQKQFEGNIVEAKTLKEIEKAVDNEKIVKVCFCSMEKDGEKCANKIKEDITAEVRGVRFGEKETELKSAKCVVCGKPAKHEVYIAKSY
ncbi:MAG: proline--tRNA ligase [archaeon]